MVVWDAVSAQTTAAAPHDVSVRGNPWGEDTKQRTTIFFKPTPPTLSKHTAFTACILLDPPTCGPVGLDLKLFNVFLS